MKMRVLAIAAIITSLAAPAFAAEDPSKAEQYRFEEQKKKEAEEIERASRTRSRGQPANNLPRKQTRRTHGEVYASLPLALRHCERWPTTAHE
jgi:hypothetical protein